jgi:hypothetical protein
VIFTSGGIRDFTEVSERRADRASTALAAFTRP